MTNLLNEKNKKNKKKGFTLMELIIVLAVMAIIAAIAIPSFLAVRDNSKKKADTQSCETIKRTVLTLVADGTIPTEATTCDVTFDSNGAITAVSNDVLETAGDDTSGFIKRALASVKKPQVSTKVKFVITITAAGDVSVTTA